MFWKVRLRILNFSFKLRYWNFSFIVNELVQVNPDKSLPECVKTLSTVKFIIQDFNVGFSLNEVSQRYLTAPYSLLKLL